MFGFYRVASCSPMVKVADTAFNAKHILALAEKAAANSATIALFPELAVSAYSCGDLFHNETLLNAAEDAVAEIARKTAGLPVILVVGAPVRFNSRLFNAALVIRNGSIRGIVPKTNLPNYREFYEKRHFSSGGGIAQAAVDFAGQSEIPTAASSHARIIPISVSALKSARTCGARSPRVRTLRSTVRF